MSSVGERRQFRRHVTDMEVGFTAQGRQAADARMIDLSEAGAAIRGSLAVQAGDLVTLSGLMREPVTARVVSRTDDIVHVQFRHDLAAQAQVKEFIMSRFPQVRAAA